MGVWQLLAATGCIYISYIFVKHTVYYIRILFVTISFCNLYSPAILALVEGRKILIYPCVILHQYIIHVVLLPVCYPITSAGNWIIHQNDICHLAMASLIYQYINAQSNNATCPLTAIHSLCGGKVQKNWLKRERECTSHFNIPYCFIFLTNTQMHKKTIVPNMYKMWISVPQNDLIMCWNKNVFFCILLQYQKNYTFLFCIPSPLQLSPDNNGYLLVCSFCRSSHSPHYSTRRDFHQGPMEVQSKR